MCRSLTIPASYPPLKTAHYSPMLHNALLAVATAFSDDPAIKDPATRHQFADKAKSCLESECELPKLSAISALSVLSNYYSSTNHRTLGYLYFGMFRSRDSNSRFLTQFRYPFLVGICARISQARKLPCTSQFHFQYQFCFYSWFRHRLLTVGRSWPDIRGRNAGPQLDFVGDFLSSMSYASLCILVY